MRIQPIFYIAWKNFSGQQYMFFDPHNPHTRKAHQRLQVFWRHVPCAQRRTATEDSMEEKSGHALTHAE